jgi:hypothetical protein
LLESNGDVSQSGSDLQQKDPALVPCLLKLVVNVTPSVLVC